METRDGDRWYRPEAIGSQRSLTLGELERHHRRAGHGYDPALHVPGQRWLLGYAIPPFQRPLVWSREQQVRFVESAARGLHLGTWMYNDAQAFPEEAVGGRAYLARTDRWLIDGQQRLNALHEFFSDAFPVFGKLWSEVSTSDRRRFLNQAFPAQEIQANDEAVLRRLYDTLNFGGVRHAEDQRACPEDDDAPAGPGMR
jgi:hypothetical protein